MLCKVKKRVLISIDIKVIGVECLSVECFRWLILVISKGYVSAMWQALSSIHAF